VAERIPDALRREIAEWLTEPSTSRLAEADHQARVLRLDRDAALETVAAVTDLR